MGVIDKTQVSQIEVEKKLKGLDSSDVLQQPTLPTKKVAPKRSLITIMAALAAGFAPVTLGPRVLRAETAPLAVLAVCA